MPVTTTRRLLIMVMLRVLKLAAADQKQKARALAKDTKNSITDKNGKAHFCLPPWRHDGGGAQVRSSEATSGRSQRQQSVMG
jgi:hypothetical protein